MTDTTDDAGTNALAPDGAVLEAPEVVIEEKLETASDAPYDSETKTESEPKPHHLKGKTPWYMERINEETNKRRSIEERATQVERERDEFKALVERLQAGKDAPAPVRTQETPDIDALVDARAARKLFDADCNEVAGAWGRENAGFAERLAILQGAGVMPAKDGSNTDFLMDVIAVDKANAHKILENLASDPDRAIMLHRMDSRRRVAELTRMTLVTEAKPAATPKPAAVSKVPAPKPVLEAVRAPEEMDENDMTDAQWSAWRKKQMQKTA